MQTQGGEWSTIVIDAEGEQNKTLIWFWHKLRSLLSVGQCFLGGWFCVSSACWALDTRRHCCTPAPSKRYKSVIRIIDLEETTRATADSVLKLLLLLKVSSDAAVTVGEGRDLASLILGFVSSFIIYHWMANAAKSVGAKKGIIIVCQSVRMEENFTMNAKIHGRLCCLLRSTTKPPTKYPMKTKVYVKSNVHYSHLSPLIGGKSLNDVAYDLYRFTNKRLAHDVLAISHSSRVLMLCLSSQGEFCFSISLSRSRPFFDNSRPN